MALARDTQFMIYERTLHNQRSEWLTTLRKQIEGIDEHAEWATLIRKAQEAGLEKEDFVREFSCAWSTVTRWMAGQTKPGPFARTAIKQKLLTLVDAKAHKEIDLAQQLAYA